MNTIEGMDQVVVKNYALTEWLNSLLSQTGLPDAVVDYISLFVVAALSVLVVYIAELVVKFIVKLIFKQVAGVGNIQFFGLMLNNKFHLHIARFLSYSILASFLPAIFLDFPGWISPLAKVLNIYLIYVFIKLIMSVVKSSTDSLAMKPAFQHKSFKSYLQVIQIILFIIGAIIAYSILTEKTLTAVLATLGAASAILMLMFQSTIMGFVASIQISSNDIARLGDWITVPKYGADGDVEEINLTTVKIRNFDKTITTVPTQALISDSFQNWRGMRESGGRRITRAFMIKHSSIRFVSEVELESFKKVAGLKDYIEHKEKEFETINKNYGGDKSIKLNNAQLTNVMLYIEYLKSYLKNHPDINKNMTCMVRQQTASSGLGLPIQLYAFVSPVGADYEHILGEIYAHAIVSAPEFDIAVFELVSETETAHPSNAGQAVKA